MPSEDSYSIKEMIEEFRTDVAKNFTDVNNSFNKIISRQDIANGRTSKSELKIASLQWWRNAIIWFVGVLVVLAPMIFSLIQSQIKDTVVGVLADYDITIQK